MVSVLTHGPRRGVSSAVRWEVSEVGSLWGSATQGGSSQGWRYGSWGRGCRSLPCGFSSRYFQVLPSLMRKRHIEETEAHREGGSHKGQISQHRNLYFLLAASQETFGVPSKWGLEMLPQRLDPTLSECEGIYPDQRRDRTQSHEPAAFPRAGTQLSRTLHPDRWTDKESGQ